MDSMTRSSQPRFDLLINYLSIQYEIDSVVIFIYCMWNLIVVDGQMFRNHQDVLMYNLNILFLSSLEGTLNQL